MELPGDYLDAQSRESRQQKTTALVASFLAIGFVAITLRYICRFIIVKRYGSEDYLLGIAFAASVGTAVCQIMQVENGVGRHILAIPFNQLSTALKYYFASVILYTVSLCFTKLSVLLLYRKVFHSSRTVIASNVMIVFVLAYTIAAVFSTIFACTPVSASWQMMSYVWCAEIDKIYIANAVLDVVSDVAVVVLPMPAILSLRISTGDQISLFVIVAIGASVCAMGGLRLAEIVNRFNAVDVTWNLAPIAYWSAVEINVAILCACLPTLRPFVDKFFGIDSRTFASSQSDESALGREEPTVCAELPNNEVRNAIISSEAPTSTQVDATPAASDHSSNEQLPSIPSGITDFSMGQRNTSDAV